MRASKVVLLTLGGVVTVAVLAVWVLLKQGISARAEPSPLEARLARLARRIATPANARALKNPYPPTQESVFAVKKHFVDHCSACHALDGSGNTVFGRNMYPRVPDLRGRETQNLSDGELHYIISNGVRFTGMPAFAGEEAADEIWKLVSFIRRLPELSPEELREMEQMSSEAEDGDSGEEPSHAHEVQN
jgi:mono/diheme cytochrome c family protein